MNCESAAFGAIFKHLPQTLPSMSKNKIIPEVTEQLNRTTRHE